MSVKGILQDLKPQKPMQFAPVQEDDDELSQFIQNDPLAHDDQWDLSEDLDGEKLEAFWSDALSELGPLETEQDEQL